MIRTLYYKEWIKVRAYYLLASIVSFAFTLYSLLRVYRVVGMKGAGHLWEVMIAKDVIFIDYLQYLPLVVGLAMAVVQFAPEMYHKSLKLTLHLPFSAERVTFAMLSAGFGLLVLLFAANVALLYLGLLPRFALELVDHIVLTSVTWFLAGIAAYFLAAWIVLEPTWRMRVAGGLVSILTLRIFFLSTTPEAYNGFLPLLSLITILLSLFSWLSVERFKAGKQ